MFERYNDFTFEYYNDPNVKDVGEWFKLASQMYFYGYINSSYDGYSRYYIIIVPLFRLYLNSKDYKWIKNHTKQNNVHGKSNFIYVPFDNIPEECFYIKS